MNRGAVIAEFRYDLAEARQVSQAYEIVEIMFEDRCSDIVLDVFEIISPQSVKIIVVDRRRSIAIWKERRGRICNHGHPGNTVIRDVVLGPCVDTSA